MPVYEFYCPACHTIFNFLSSRVDTQSRPDCPRCGRPRLERQVSLFAIARGRGDDDPAVADDPLSGLDPERLERVMAGLAGEMEGLEDQDDPRQAAKFMQKFLDATGLEPGGAMSEAMRRLESGEDPEAVEAALGDQLDAEDPFGLQKARRVLGRLRPPAQDDRLYDL